MVHSDVLTLASFFLFGDGDDDDTFSEDDESDSAFDDTLDENEGEDDEGSGLNGL